MEQIKLFQVAEVQLTYRPKFKASERPRVTSSKDSYNILLEQWDDGKIDYVEEFKILLLNRGNRVLGIMNVSSGGVSGTIADPKIIFTAALKSNASALVLSHNHPSGTLKPSQPDISLTKKLVDGGKLLDITVLDHLIVTNEGYYSFADEGLL